MKILCKKNLEKQWTKDKFYDFVNYSSYYIIEGGNINKQVKLIKGYEDHIYFDYFYSPEETKNILRSKLIERMLK